ncbi:Cysteine-rich secretory protein family protein [Selenomonas ruminantium]|uniref:Cysteine-rich secretory protein family protein n=1 Tax=Selenomonas ruminantium TaxID=971 RepID=A0A1M6V3A2_SELRU|nr:CAP domain-containing protein [Selenomonas ruminantium]SHK75943.1 Cysteine-rich secretory protein family protein [Selenomonas ruminantium]
MRKLMVLLILLGVLCVSVPQTEAARFAKAEEVTRPAGTIWGYPGSNVRFEIADPRKAETFVAKNGEQRLRLKEPGDVFVKAVFYESNGDIIEYHLTFHVTGQAVDETAVDVNSYAEEVLALVNAERRKYNLEPLRLAQDLNEDAMVRARECVRHFSHQRPDGSDYNTVLRNPYKEAGENLSAGRPSAQATVEGWMNSPAHRDNILYPNFREMGIGYLYESNSRYRHYWAQLFRR